MAHYNIADRYRALIRETTGTYDFLQNDDLSQTKTATGLALLNEKAEGRMLTKNADKYTAFARLLRLADFMALENFSYSKIVKIGAAAGHKQSIRLRRNCGGGLCAAA